MLSKRKKHKGGRVIKFKSGVRVSSVITARMTEPADKGIAWVYFFPQGHAEPAIIVRAETGIMAEPPPLIPVEWIDRLPHHDWRTVAATNHYSVLIGEEGAAAVAQALRDATARARA